MGVTLSEERGASRHPQAFGDAMTFATAPSASPSTGRRRGRGVHLAEAEATTARGIYP